MFKLFLIAALLISSGAYAATPVPSVASSSASVSISSFSGGSGSFSTATVVQSVNGKTVVNKTVTTTGPLSVHAFSSSNGTATFSFK